MHDRGVRPAVRPAAYAAWPRVGPDAARGTRAMLTARRAELPAPAEADGWGAGLAVDLRKIDEAFAYAEARGFAFCEATEIYGGIGGSLN